VLEGSYAKVWEKVIVHKTHACICKESVNIKTQDQSNTYVHMMSEKEAHSYSSKKYKKKKKKERPE